jgi:hypothetical protein
MSRSAGPWAQVSYDRIDFKGGLDMLTPTLNLQPGFVRAAQNFEISITGGYARVAGYERFDGHPSPTATASYQTMTLSALGTIVAGSVITGATSGTVATCIGINPGAVGRTIGYVTSSGPGFVFGENITVSAVVQGTVTVVPAIVLDAATIALFLQGATNLVRPTISAPPGSGGVLGGFWLNGTNYCFRNNAGGTVANLWGSSSAGWVQVPYGYELLYTAGAGTQPAVGATITGATSGAHATIAAVINQTGGVTIGLPAWVASTGRFILTAITGTFVNAEALQVSAATVATASGTQVAIAPNPGGKYVVDVQAFAGGTATTNVAYGASGVDRGFSFDGTVYVPITTGSVPDTPSYARKHLNYLVFGILNSVQISGLGLPYQWTPLSGGAELILPENVSNIMPLPGNQATGALGVFTQNYTYILYGSSQLTFQLVPYNIKAGAYFNTAANMADTYVFEVRGVTSLTTTLQYGNFDPAYLTMPNKPFIDAHRGSTTCAFSVRTKSQYRVFFSDGYALWSTFLNKQYAGCLPIYYPNPVSCAWDGVDTVSGAQRLFFGSTNGMVYEMDIGTSFDGAVIGAYLQFVFDSIKSHRVLKRYRKLSLEVNGESYAPISLAYQLGYSAATIGQPASANYGVPFLGSLPWDSFVWDSFIWDGVSLAPVEMELRGTAENFALYLSSSSDSALPFTINTATAHYTIRRGLR